MATYYWVGGSGTWDASTTTNWATSSGGTGGAGFPTSADDVIFDAASNVGTGAFTVTVSGASCRDFSTGGAGGALDGAMTLAMGTSTLSVFGSWTNPASNFAFSGTGTITFASTTTGNTVTANGVSWTSAVVFDGVGGGWTLGSALTTTSNLTVTNGSFSTSASNYNLTTNIFSSSNANVRTISFNGSTVTCTNSGTGFTFSTATNLTFNAGTSTVICSASATFNGGGQTFYNFSFTSAASATVTVNGANTFNNLTFTSRSATGFRGVIFTANQTVNGTLTFGAANTAIRRYLVYGNTNTGTGVGTPITLTVATLATLADVDFRDITAAGASAPWSGTRIGDGGGNSNITFTAGATKYWNLAAGGNWSATAWALGSGGAVDVNNFPLAQDTVVIEDTGLNTSATITVDVGWWIPNIGASTRTLAFTLASGTTTPQIFGDFNIPSVVTVTGTGVWYFGANNKTQLITTNGVSLTWAFVCNGATNNTVRLAGNTTSTSGNVNLTQGTFDLNNNTLTCVVFASNQSVVRTLAFGTGNITVTGNSGAVVSLTTVTNLTITGTPVFNATYSGSTGTRTFNMGNIGEASAISVNVTAGSDTVSFATTNGSYKNIVMTGFSGIMSFANSINIYGNLTLSATQTVNTGSQTVGFAATSGTQTITTNGVTFDRPININAPGATVQLGSALTMGSTRTLTFTAGTFTTTASNYNVTAGAFNSNNANVRTLSLNGSTVTLQGTGAIVWYILDPTNLTLNAGTSSLIFTGNIGAINFYGGSKTYYNITLPTDIYTFNFQDDNNTFNNVTCTRTTTGVKSIVYRPFTVNGTLTLTGSSGNQQIFLRAAAYGTPQILTATAVSFTDVIFRDIDAAGAAIPWTGTRLGDAGGNTDITFAAPKTVYWNKVAGGNWYDDAWATSSGGATATTNQPLPQDTVIFDNTGINAGSTITTPITSAEVGALDCSTLTNAITFDTTNAGFSIYKDVTLSSAVTFSGAFNINCNTPPSATQLIDISAATINVGFGAVPRGTCRLASALTISGDCIFATGGGTFDLNDFKITCGTFNIFADTLNRTLAFGTGSIDVTGNNTTVWGAADLTGFSYTGTPTVNFTYAGSTGTRTITNGSTAGGTEANAVDFNITAGSDITTTAGSIVRNFNCTGYSGAGSLFGNGYIYGNLTLSATQTVSVGVTGPTFSATSGTKTITTNGVTIDRPLTFDGVGGTWQLGSALTQTTHSITLTNGTFNTANYNLTTAGISSNNTNTRGLTLGSSTVTIASISGDVLTFGTSPTTGLAFNAGTSNIVIVSTGDRTFKGAGETFNTVTLNTAFKTTFQGTGTKFRTLTNTTSPTTAEFEAGSTFYFNNFTLSGTSGNLVTIQSSVPTTQFTLNKVTGGNVNVSFCSITDSAASPAGYWYSPTSSGNVDGGNNTGWNFATGLSTGNGFMMFF